MRCSHNGLRFMTNENPTIRGEHQVFGKESYPEQWAHNFIEYDGLLLNSEKNDFDKRYFIKWDNLYEGWQYYTSYVIGAQWLDKDAHVPLIVLPKDPFKDIDFLRIFVTCLNAGIEPERFSGIYGIDIDKPKIEAPNLNGIISPLIIVHFISAVRQLLRTGLKRDYQSVEANLKKLRGKLSPIKNERINIIPKRYERAYCIYQEYTLDIPENRLIKKALLFSRRALHTMFSNSSSGPIIQALNQCLSVFGDVSDKVNVSEVFRSRNHKLYKGYEDACRMAAMILLRFDYSIAKTSDTSSGIPPFWIDMPMLFELYVLGLLKSIYNNNIHYQFKGNLGERPDFLLKTDTERLILDTKYMDEVEGKIDIIRQLSGYSRSNYVLEKLGAEKKDGDYSEIVPCVLIYPYVSSDNMGNPFNGAIPLLSNDNCVSVDGYCKFYKFRVPLPQNAH